MFFKESNKKTIGSVSNGTGRCVIVAMKTVFCCIHYEYSLAAMPNVGTIMGYVTICFRGCWMPTA